MNTITANHKMYFDCHPQRNEFWFTSDGLAFPTQDTAKNHANALLTNKKGAATIELITRAQVDAWAKDTTPAEENKADTRTPQQIALDDAKGQLDAANVELTDAETSLANANTALIAANNAKLEENGSTTPAQKAANTRAITAGNKLVTDATARVASATQSVTDAQAAYDKLTAASSSAVA